MTKIPFEKQYLIDPVERIKLDRAQGVAVSGDALLHAIEWSIGQPTGRLLCAREVGKSSISAINRRGRATKQQSPGTLRVRKGGIHRYPALLQKYEEDANNGVQQQGGASQLGQNRRRVNWLTPNFCGTCQKIS